MGPTDIRPSVFEQCVCAKMHVTLELTIAKRMAVCRFYRDPLRKVIFRCSETVIRLIF